MMVLLNLFFAIAGITALYYGADFLVKGGTAAARKAGISELVIGLTLVAFATSAPELVVSIRAALAGSADLSLGNIVGSNICNIALILGLCACISPLSVQKRLFRIDAPVMLGAAVLLSIFYFFSGGINRIEGVFFLLILIVYTVFSIRISRNEQTQTEQTPVMPLWLAILLILSGTGMLIGGAELFLRSAVFFARLFHLSDAVIGLTVVAVGTSLPELATSVVAAWKGKQELAVGNVLGSNIFNILGILGIVPLIQPLAGATLNLVDLGVMLFCSLMLLPLMRTGWKISRAEGVFFLIVYLGYTAYLLVQHV